MPEIEVFINWNTATQFLLPGGVLVFAYVAFRVVSYINPGYGKVPIELSEALNWLDTHATDARILAWWDYTEPLNEYTDTIPIVDGPSPEIREFVDNPNKVNTWESHDDIESVAAFFLPNHLRKHSRTFRLLSSILSSFLNPTYRRLQPWRKP